MSALLDAQSQASSSSSSTTATKSQSKALKDLFNQIDSDGDSSISKTEFESALGAGGTNTANADSVFSKLDKDGNGKVSLDELGAALKGGKSKHAHHAKPQGETDQTDPLLQALYGASTSSTTNSDGTTTTALTYADGSKVTMTSAASASTNAASSYNFLEQMIQRQASAVSASGSLVSVSA